MTTKKTATKPNKREAKVADKAKAKKTAPAKSASKGKCHSPKGPSHGLGGNTHQPACDKFQITRFVHHLSGDDSRSVY